MKRQTVLVVRSKNAAQYRPTGKSRVIEEYLKLLRAAGRKIVEVEL